MEKEIPNNIISVEKQKPSYESKGNRYWKMSFTLHSRLPQGNSNKYIAVNSNKWIGN